MLGKPQENQQSFRYNQVARIGEGDGQQIQDVSKLMQPTYRKKIFVQNMQINSKVFSWVKIIEDVVKAMCRS